ncbi:hypothetical protein [Nocardia sp. NPDC058666]|uniref:hypothetical protein n=1 Tax=unclassified Nocardia TaxID=2637762 RepID=UPI0036588DCC
MSSLATMIVCAVVMSTATAWGDPNAPSTTPPTSAAPSATTTTSTPQATPSKPAQSSSATTEPADAPTTTERPTARPSTTTSAPPSTTTVTSAPPVTLTEPEPVGCISETPGKRNKPEKWAPTKNPNRKVTPGKMRSDCEEVPGGFTKEQADKAETMEAAVKSADSTEGGATVMVAPGCQVYWPAPYEVCGAIRDKYNELGGPNSFLLWPTSNELTNPDGVGRRNTFTNGPIYWSPWGGAHPVANHFFAAWQRNGWEGGILGYPTSDEFVNGDGIGRRQYFDGGTVYWRLNEAYFVAGAIRDKWGETGWEGGFLGYPSSDETGTAVGGGRFNTFERGVIYWSGAGGAHPVVGGVLDKWAKSGYEGGTYGFPIGDQTSRDANVTVEQQFQGGLITAPGPAATELAYLNPGTTAEQMIAEAQAWAQRMAKPVIDVLNETLRKGREYTEIGNTSDTPSEDDMQDVPDARGPGDIFYADSSLESGLVSWINHGHMAIFVSKTNTVESNNSKGVFEIDNSPAGPTGVRRKMRNPKLAWVNTSDEIRAKAVAFALSKKGKGYNNNFAFSDNIEDEQYHCAQIVWASYMHASNEDVDLRDPVAKHISTGVYPKEVFRSSWLTRY